MSLDKIHLPGFLWASLFKDTIVDTNPPVDHPVQKTTIDFLGGNQKHVLFVTSHTGHKFIPDDQLHFLNNLLAACGLTMADIALINVASQSSSYLEVKKQLHPKVVLLMGVTAPEMALPFAIPLFQVQRFQDQRYLICPSMQDLQHDKELKKQLWACLKKVFDL